MRNLLDVLEVRADESAEAIIAQQIAGHGTAILTVTDASGQSAVVELRKKKAARVLGFSAGPRGHSLRTR